MFIIHTANANQPYHRLTTIERLVLRDRAMGADGLELELRVRTTNVQGHVSHTFQYFLIHQDRGLTIEVITLEQLAFRKELAKDNGAVYDDSMVQSLDSKNPTLLFAQEVQAYFMNLMSRESFRLPVTV